MFFLKKNKKIVADVLSIKKKVVILQSDCGCEKYRKRI